MCGQDLRPPDSGPHGPALDHEFERLVEEALQHLHDLAALRHHRLAALLTDSPQSTAGQVLQHRLVQALESLTASVPSSTRLGRALRYLRLRYLEGLDSAQAAARLGITDRQGRRDRLIGVRALAAFLWETYVRSAPRRPPTAAQVAEHLAALEAEVERLRGTIPSDVLDLGEVLATALRTTAPLAVARRVTIAVQPTSDRTLVTASRSLLRQVVIGLLVFALEWVEDCTLTLALRRDAQQVTLALQGEKVQGHPDPTALALLATIERLAGLVGGRLLAEALGEGGLAVQCVLPAARRHRILLIDDNQEFGALLQHLFGQAYQVLQATTAAEALDLIAAAPPEVIILDILLPGVDGWELFERLRSHPALKFTPIIVCSVLGEEPLALALGAAAFLAKPVDRHALLTTVERCLTRPPAAAPDTGAAS